VCGGWWGVERPQFVGLSCTAHDDFSVVEYIELCLVKYAVHPASHSCPMERRDPLASSSNTWACVAVSGRLGMLRLQVWVDCIVALFGSRTWIPLLVAFTLVMGMALWMYW